MAMIDVVIPVYNAEPTLCAAIASIQAQTLRDIRILLIDDGSTDGSPAIMAALAAEDSRITVITQANGGIVAALNHGLSHCTAEFIARHDSDDLAAPERFALQLAWLQANPTCVGVGGAVQHIDGAGVPFGGVKRFPSPEEADALWVPSREPYLLHPFLMVRREAIAKVGRYRNAMHAEDTDLYWRLLDIGTLHNLPDLLGSYRVHLNSISGSRLTDGRIQALGSQLAGLSAARRRAGKADIAFPAVSDYRAAARSLAALHALIAPALDAAERGWLRIALAVKLLELAAFRPYELERADCAFIRAAIAEEGGRVIDSANRKQIRASCSGAAARLAANGRLGDAITVAPIGYWPASLFRLALRVGLPQGLRRRLKSSLGHEVLLK